MTHWLEHLGVQGGLPQVAAFVQKVCPPVFLHTQSGEVRNGSMVLVSDGTRTLGLTAGHVADAINEHVSHADICQVGAARLLPGSLIERSKDLDLATYALDESTVRESRHLPFLVRHWPLPDAERGDTVIGGGWPGCYRTNPEGRYDNAFVTFAGQIESVSENNLGILVDLKNGRSFTQERVDPDADLGGISGGPIFRLLPELEEGGLGVRFQLVGIVHTSGLMMAQNIVMAHRLTTLLSDGHFTAALTDNRR
jgi:hypothetical protein